MTGIPVSQTVRDVQVTMAKISCQNIIRPDDESLDPDGGDYISGSEAGPETEEDRSTSN